MEAEIKVAKIRRLNLLLTAIRDVGRLLVSESVPHKLIQGICEILVEKRGYYNAWICLLGEDNRVDYIADAGKNPFLDRLRKPLKRRAFTRCVVQILDSDAVTAVLAPEKECGDCLLAQAHFGRGGLAVRISHGGITYGFLVVSIPRHLAADETEKHIFKEMADDIGAALHRLDLAAKREAAERQSQAHFKSLVQNSLNHISIIQNHEIIYQTPGMRNIHAAMDHVFVPPEFPYIHPGDREGVIQQYQDLLTGRIQRMEADFRYYPLEGAGRVPVKWALLSATTIDYLGVESVLSHMMDITNSKEVENYLRIQDKMSSLGRVSAGIAHEIRNPLSGIYIYLKALKQKLPWEVLEGDRSSDALAIIHKIEMTANKIESIIKRVMDFAKPGHPRFVMADLNVCLEEVSKLISVTLRKQGIRFVHDLDPKLPQCCIEPHLMEQVVLNLITNAAEAMEDHPGDKCIGLTTRFYPERRDKGCAEIRVWDTGPGIPASQQSKIFDPFYSTKANSSGIGLSIGHRIVLDHGGILKLDGSRKMGAEFTIELPLGREKEGV